MSTAEPPRPERGTTAEERPPELSAAEQRLEDATTWPQRIWAAASLRLVLAQADGYPAGIKQFLWLCLVLVYPAWLFVVLIAWPVAVVGTLIGKALEALLMLLFWPIRRRHFKNNPEEYAAWQAKHGKGS